METFVDREYKIHLTVAKAGLLYLLMLADTPLLPFTMKRYDDVMKRSLRAMRDELKFQKVKDVDTRKCFS